MDEKTRPAGEPAMNFHRIMRSEPVQDQMNLESTLDLLIDGCEESEEIGDPVPGPVLVHQFAAIPVQGYPQRVGHQAVMRPRTLPFVRRIYRIENQLPRIRM